MSNWRPQFLALVIGGALCLGATNPTRVSAQPEDAAAEPTETVTSFDVPAGGPAEWLAFIEKIEGIRPSEEQRESRDALYGFIRKSRDAIVKAAEKILAAESAEEEAKQTARMKKVEAMALLIQAEAPKAVENLRQYAAQLKADGHADLAQTADLQALLALVRGMVLLEGKERDARYQEVRGILMDAPKDRGYVSVAMRTIQVLEMTGSETLAAGAYRDFAKVYAESDDEAVRQAAEQFSRSARRLSLVGNAFAAFAGQSVKGDAFQSQTYQDKVILIDFWATWCGPCVAELPNVKDNYDKYHEKGFEVVGVSLDDDHKALEKFLVDNEVPWVTLLGSETKVTDEENVTLADYYGVTAIPTVILIGPDGKVVSIGARGEELGNLLEKLLGPPLEKPADDSDAEADKADAKPAS